MRKYNWGTGFLLFLLLTSARFVVADESMRREFRQIEAPATDALTTVEISWFEKANAIVPESVCLEVAGDATGYRFCRQRARVLFKDECADYTTKFNQAELPEALELRILMKKFCAAAKTFVP